MYVSDGLYSLFLLMIREILLGSFAFFFFFFYKKKTAYEIELWVAWAGSCEKETVRGGGGGGVLGAELTRRACTIFLGVATRGSGALTCAIVGGAAGGYAGGNLGGDGGKFLGGKVIEMEGDLIFQPEGA
ncbi:hypothetical protein [Pseudomonas simiae]|uniref:hypothetical protein n=1 Tax=Pseudomonas simiae TaxID=321846 RepID=UPI002E32A0CC|nr:hypothetical protein [Pseudomonas simiae]